MFPGYSYPPLEITRLIKDGFLHHRPPASPLTILHNMQNIPLRDKEMPYIYVAAGSTVDVVQVQPVFNAQRAASSNQSTNQPINLSIFHIKDL
jgi:hypothetical protein